MMLIVKWTPVAKNYMKVFFLVDMKRLIFFGGGGARVRSWVDLTAIRQATLVVERSRYIKKLIVDLWVSFKTKKVSCLRINSQTLIYYIHLCHLHISIRPFITKHYTLSTAGRLYIDSNFLQIRQWIDSSLHVD